MSRIFESVGCLWLEGRSIPSCLGRPWGVLIYLMVIFSACRPEIPDGLFKSVDRRCYCIDSVTVGDRTDWCLLFYRDKTIQEFHVSSNDSLYYVVKGDVVVGNKYEIEYGNLLALGYSWKILAWDSSHLSLGLSKTLFHFTTVDLDRITYRFQQPPIQGMFPTPP